MHLLKQTTVVCPETVQSLQANGGATVSFENVIETTSASSTIATTTTAGLNHVEQ